MQFNKKTLKICLITLCLLPTRAVGLPQFDGANFFMEIWKPIESHAGLYEISNSGKIKSIQRVVPHPRWGTQTIKEKILRPGSNPNGYLIVRLSKNGLPKYFSVHRLVANAFIPNPLNLPQINHIDGDKLNNNDWNLEWCTAQQNNTHALITGLKKHLPRRLTDNDLSTLRTYTFQQRLEFSKINNVNMSTINRWLKRTKI